MAFRARKIFGTLEKRAPDHKRGNRNSKNPYYYNCDTYNAAFDGA